MQNVYLPSHLMARDRYEEQISLIWILRTKPTLPDILKEISLTRILSCQLPRRLVKRIRIPIRIYVNLELPLHLGVIQPKNLRRMIYIRQFLHLIVRNRLNSTQNE